MSMIREREGVIKYHFRHDRRPISVLREWNAFFSLRSMLFNRKLIGVDDQGLGYGNMSCRLCSSPRFLITGSQTSGLPEITCNHLAEVTRVDIEKNFLAFSGDIQASSEAMTHAALYQANFGIKAVIHVHSPSIWHATQGKLPTTKENVAYGTPQMAFEMIRLHRRSALGRSGVIVLGGHLDGMIAFGPSLQIAGKLILNLDQKHGSLSSPDLNLTLIEKRI